MVGGGYREGSRAQTWRACIHTEVLAAAAFTVAAGAVCGMLLSARSKRQVSLPDRSVAALALFTLS